MLHELKLPRENTITVLVAGSRPSMDTNMPLDRTISVDLSRLYELRIEVNITEGQVLKLDIKEPGTKTVAEVLLIAWLIVSLFYDTFVNI